MGLEVNSLVRYHALADLVRQRIMDGIYPRGTRLAAEQDLAVELDCCRDTVRDALDVLRWEGLIIKERGRRAVVAPVLDHAAVLLAPGSTVLARMPFRPELGQLGCRPETPILEVTAPGTVTRLHPADRVLLTVPC